MKTLEAHELTVEIFVALYAERFGEFDPPVVRQAVKKYCEDNRARNGANDHVSTAWGYYIEDSARRIDELTDTESLWEFCMRTFNTIPAELLDLIGKV